ncbi:hypothetical protein ACHZ97_04325 [Lysobacter soli]|uniref:hypothetical protein n=1 Tax=Lysobacter soli TaxID=453783 RepID=UPI0037C80967
MKLLLLCVLVAAVVLLWRRVRAIEKGSSSKPQQPADVELERRVAVLERAERLRAQAEAESKR